MTIISFMCFFFFLTGYIITTICEEHCNIFLNFFSSEYIFIDLHYYGNKLYPWLFVFKLHQKNKINFVKNWFFLKIICYFFLFLLNI